MDGGAQKTIMRAGTENTAAIVGMTAALRKNNDILDQNTAYVMALEKLFPSEMDKAGINYVRNGCNTLPGLLSLSFPGHSGENILHRMDLKEICISTGSACNGSSDEISHVLQALQLHEKVVKGTIRISLGKNNTKEEVHILVQSLFSIAKRHL